MAKEWYESRLNVVVYDGTQNSMPRPMDEETRINFVQQNNGKFVRRISTGGTRTCDVVTDMLDLIYFMFEDGKHEMTFDTYHECIENVENLLTNQEHLKQLRARNRDFNDALTRITNDMRDPKKKQGFLTTFHMSNTAALTLGVPILLVFMIMVILYMNGYVMKSNNQLEAENESIENVFSNGLIEYTGPVEYNNPQNKHEKYRSPGLFNPLIKKILRYIDQSSAFITIKTMEAQENRKLMRLQKEQIEKNLKNEERVMNVCQSIAGFFTWG